MALQGISTYCGQNVGGFGIIEYLPTDFIDAANFEIVISNAYNFQRDVSHTGAWMKAPVMPDGKIWEERMRDNAQGVFYEQEAGGILATHTPALSGELNEMKQHRFLIRLTDKEGQKWLLGTLEHPFRFFADFLGGDGISGLKHHRIKWRSETPDAAFGFVPVF